MTGFTAPSPQPAAANAPAARQDDVDLACRLAKDVAQISMRWFNAVDLNVITKADGSPVTQGDLAVEQRLRELLREADPDAAIVGEEEGVTGDGARRWILDPIDGTSAFSRGVPLWSTLIALHDEHGPAVGLIALPALDEIVVAGRGLGATYNGAPCRVSTTSALADAVVTTWGYDHWEPAWFPAFQQTGCSMRGWSDAYGWALLATGRVDAVVDPTTKLWDIAAMQVIVPEAGGAFDARPAEENLHYRWAAGTNGALHGAVTVILDGDQACDTGR